MPMYESLPVRVVLTVKVGGHVLTFEETGKATGARYHGADPRKSDRSTSNSLESRICGVAGQARVYLARAYPVTDDAPAPAAAQPAEPIDWGTCPACGESEANCRAIVECCGECATAGFRAMHVPAAPLLDPPPSEPAAAPTSSVPDGRSCTVDPGREHRIDALVTAVGKMIGQYGVYPEGSPMHIVDNACMALVGYVSPTLPPAEPAPAPMSSVRAALHALAPPPWAADADGDIFDARGKRQFSELTGARSVPGLRGELVARIVNEAGPAPAAAAVALRALAVDEVLAAARGYAALAGSTPPPAERLCRAVRALDALDGSDGAT